MNIQTNTLGNLWKFALAMMLAIGVLSTSSFAAKGVNATSSGVAIKGYDPVAYFTVGKPVKGKKEFTVDYHGNKWQLSSAENKKLFLANPYGYIPQYGGFCAFAASNNAIAGIDPRAFTIENNKLYLNYSKRIRKTWQKSKVQRIVDADRNWPTLKNKVQ